MRRPAPPTHREVGGASPSEGLGERESGRRRVVRRAARWVVDEAALPPQRPPAAAAAARGRRNWLWRRAHVANGLGEDVCVCDMCVRECVRACVRSCVRACVRACGVCVTCVRRMGLGRRLFVAVTDGEEGRHPCVCVCVCGEDAIEWRRRGCDDGDRVQRNKPQQAATSRNKPQQAATNRNIPQYTAICRNTTDYGQRGVVAEVRDKLQ